MNKARALLRMPGGRRTKWAVLVFWLIVVAVAGPLAGKLTGAEKNDAQAWLPAKAESTQVLKLQSSYQSPNTFPAVMVYYRPAGMTASDLHKAASDVAQFAGVPGVLPQQIAGPFRSHDGQAIETVVPVNLGASG
jgi:RND superfamily putative drug exporter